jgi:hypothetical protein
MRGKKHSSDTIGRTEADVISTSILRDEKRFGSCQIFRLRPRRSGEGGEAHPFLCI